MIKSLIFFTFLLVILCQQYPIFNYSYQISFDETIIRDQTYNIKGQQFYDPINKRERVDRTNGRYNLFCGSVLPDVDAPCTSLTNNGNRWIVYSARSQCCLCCTSQQGCGILSPDWLKGSDYQGDFVIKEVNCEKWSKKGAFGDNFLYVTKEGQIPRRLDEGGVQIADYDLGSFDKKDFTDSIFAVPSYCRLQDQPIMCPSSSICAQLGNKNNLSSQ